MPHPQNKRDHFLVGVKKSRKRVSNFYYSVDVRKQREIAARYLRNTTKRCSQYCCGNPRRHYKGISRLTIQERKFFS